MDLFPDLGGDATGPLRSVVYEEAAARHVDEQTSHHLRLPDIMQYLEWQLARKPANRYAEQMPFPNADVWLFKIGPYPALGIPSVLVLYRFDDERVTIWNVRVSKG